jgi:toxin CcdB
MAKFDVYPAAAGKGYLLDVQADVLTGLNSRTVVPLMPLNIAQGQRLNPDFEVEGEKVAMVTQYIAAIPAVSLGQPVANLSNHFAEVTNALDMLFQGF